MKADTSILEQLLAVGIPSIWIYYALVGPHLPALQPRILSFGGPETYLDVEYPQGPGAVEPLTSGVVLGTWVTRKGEERVRGRFEKIDQKIEYVFETSQGRLIGKLDSSTRDCEPELRFEVRKNGVPAQTGAMRGAFCLSTTL